MELLHYARRVPDAGPLVIAVGKFDGFHLGHRKIVAALCARAADSGMVPSVFTFRTFPVDFTLTPWEERVRLLAEAGVRVCIWSDFADIAQWEPRRFVGYLAGRNVRHVVVGAGFVFGAGRAGDVRFLRREASRFGMGVSVVRCVTRGGGRVSSSRIRACLRRGEIESATAMLGRHFSVEGTVVAGAGRGRRLGFPTANLRLSHPLFLPDGVYAGWASVSGRAFRGAAVFIGASPTFADPSRKFEVFIDGARERFFGRTMRVLLVSRIREARRFSSGARLREQIQRDVDLIRGILRRSPPLTAAFDGSGPKG